MSRPGDTPAPTAVPLAGKVALVTGASRGIGRALALALAEDGADVVVAARTTTPRGDLTGTIGDTAREVTELGRRSLAIAVDLAAAQEVDHLVHVALEEYGRVDILVNNAAAMDARMFETIWDMTPASWRYQVDLNLNACWLLTKALAPFMQANGGGLVVNITSGPYGRPATAPGSPNSRTGAAYLATKVAMSQLTITIAAEVRDANISVVAIHPAQTRTENAIRLGPLGGHDIAGAGHGVDLPLRVFREVLADPMRHTGTVIHAPTFATKRGWR